MLLELGSCTRTQLADTVWRLKRAIAEVEELKITTMESLILAQDER